MQSSPATLAPFLQMLSSELCSQTLAFEYCLNVVYINMDCLKLSSITICLIHHEIVVSAIHVLFMSPRA
jgi:hypothetical protein